MCLLTASTGYSFQPAIRKRAQAEYSAGRIEAQVACVTIDSNLRFDYHARNVAKACNFHTRALRHVRSLLTDDVAQIVACSIIASRLDYCNALLSGAPAATFDKLQRAQNNLARVVCQSRDRTDARPLLHSLHWLPVR